MFSDEVFCPHVAGFTASPNEMWVVFAAKFTWGKVLNLTGLFATTKARLLKQFFPLSWGEFSFPNEILIAQSVGFDLKCNTLLSGFTRGVRIN
jgi:hypothetical protein